MRRAVVVVSTMAMRWPDGRCRWHDGHMGSRLLARGLAGAAVLLPLAAAPAAHAASHSQSASSGSVSAAVAWQTSSRTGASTAHVTVNRGGTELVSEDAQPSC